MNLHILKVNGRVRKGLEATDSVPHQAWMMLHVLVYERRLPTLVQSPIIVAAPKRTLTDVVTLVVIGRRHQQFRSITGQRGEHNVTLNLEMSTFPEWRRWC